MSNDLEHVRQQAAEQFRRDQQTQMASEQQIRNNEQRMAHNAEIDRQRRLAEDRR